MSAIPVSFVVITPARNEESLIEQTILSVTAQTMLPIKWVIVSDGSTDRTDEIVQKHAAAHPWMELVRLPEHSDRHFGAKARCFNAGLEKVRDLSWDIVGNLDADITFPPDYFEFLMEKFAADPFLGVAGTPFVEGGSAYDFRFTAVEHVSGACQMFRRECYEQIGGYKAIRSGGIDWIAVTTARMMGWKTRTFVERVCHHHRPMGTASVGKLRAMFVLGRQDYYLGGHPLWEFFRGFYQLARKPFLVGGVSLVAGYCCAWITRVPRPVSLDLMRFHRHEQMVRLKRSLAKWMRLSPVSDGAN
jgi:glycosyltransferase involved in cell wall biosynthesis